MKCTMEYTMKCTMNSLLLCPGEEKSVTCRVSEWQLFENKAVWLLAGEGTAYFSPPNTDAIAAGNLSASAAHWSVWFQSTHLPHACLRFQRLCVQT